MLGKLLKNEWKITGRSFLPLYLVLIIMTPLTRIVTNLSIFDNKVLNFVKGMFLMFYVLLIIAVVLLSIFIIVNRFYKNMVTDEAYLTHTLPVKTSAHIWSKLIVSFTWMIASVALILLSIFAFCVTPDFFQTFKNAVQEMTQDFYQQTGSHLMPILIWLALAFLSQLINNILFSYASISIGQLISKHRVLGAFGTAIILYMANGIILLTCCIPLASKFLDLLNDSLLSPVLFMNQVLPLVITINLVLASIYFIITNIILKKKLNLE